MTRSPLAPVAALICALAAPVAADPPRPEAEPWVAQAPRFSGELRLGVLSQPDAGQGQLVAGARIALEIERRTDSGARLGMLVEIEGAGPSGPWRN